MRFRCCCLVLKAGQIIAPRHLISWIHSQRIPILVLVRQIRLSRLAVDLRPIRSAGWIEYVFDVDSGI